MDVLHDYRLRAWCGQDPTRDRINVFLVHDEHATVPSMLLCGDGVWRFYRDDQLTVEPFSPTMVVFGFELMAGPDGVLRALGRTQAELGTQEFTRHVDRLLGALAAYTKERVLT